MADRPNGYCHWCGGPTPAAQLNRALYCKAACKQAAYRARNSTAQKWHLTCSWCGKRFEANYWRKYCFGNACKQAAYRARKAAGMQTMF